MNAFVQSVEAGLFLTKETISATTFHIMNLVSAKVDVSGQLK